MRKEIFDYLHTGQEAITRIRVEHIIREENIMAAYEILELFCEFVLARVPILEAQKECPVELQEAIASIIFASPRCSDLPELLQIRNLFTMKYGKEFVAGASELRPDSNVNRLIIEKLTARAPSAEVKLKTLKGIAQMFNFDWDSSSTEVEFRRKHEDLLDGGVPIVAQDPALKRLSDIPSPKRRPLSAVQAPVPAVSNSPAFRREAPALSAGDLVPAVKQMEIAPNSETTATNQRSSDVLERARAAIAAAERATAAARAAAELVNVRVAPQPSNGKHSS